MAPHAEFDIEQIREKGRKDILYLLESVCTAVMPPKPPKPGSIGQTQRCPQRLVQVLN